MDFKNPQIYTEKLNDKNTIKLNQKEYDFLKEKANKAFNKNNEICNVNDYFIEISFNRLEEIDNFFNNNNIELNDVGKYVLKKIQDNKSRDKITCRKLSDSYFQDTGLKVSKNYMNKILKNKLKMSYLKTTVKTSKLNNDSGIIAAFYFIKMITKCLMLGFTILYLDETSVFSTNNNYRAWRKKTEDIYFNIDGKKRENLILTVSDKEIIHYKINSENTKEQNFLEYMNELNIILKKRVKEKFIIVMDNLSVHRTKKLMKFYEEQKLNIIFNCVYRSNFNCVELVFRRIKFTLYNKLYENIDASIIEMKNILSDSKIKAVLSHNFSETIIQYFRFYENNKEINLNNLNI